MTAVADETRSAYPVIVLLDSAAALHVCRLTWDDDNAVLLCTSVGMDALDVVVRRDHLPNLSVALGANGSHSRQAGRHVGVFLRRQAAESDPSIHPSIRPCYPSIPLPTDPPLIPPMFSRLPPTRSLLWSSLGWVSECPYSYSEVVCRNIQRRPSRRPLRFAF